MEKYGIDNVRGGPWCKIKIDSSEKDFIQKLFYFRYTMRTSFNQKSTK